MLGQICDDASDTVLIENNGVAPDWGCNTFSSDIIVFNENSIITECRHADARCKRPLNRKH